MIGMPHIHTQPGQHDLTVSAYIFIMTADEPRIMLHQHKKHQNYMQFGGHVELDENPWQAVLREIREEAGYSAHQLRVLQPPGGHVSGIAMSHPHPVCILTYPASASHKHTDVCFAFVTDETPALAIGDDESDCVYSLTQKEFEMLPPEAMFGNVRDVITQLFAVVLPQWRADRITDK
jgi:8-oxo-dGTP pyrophosphatase MutT (NUDIX family)